MNILRMNCWYLKQLPDNGLQLFGTIGNSNTSCRQVATKEQMDRF